MPLRYDLLLKGGEVIDPSQGLRGRRDVAFQGGRVAAVGESLAREEAREVVDVSGALVAPGLLDIHGHFFHRGLPNGANADVACMDHGVTTAVDAGSTGWVTFPAFRDYVVPRTRCRLFALLHLSSTGLGALAAGLPDLFDLRLAKRDEAIACIRENRDLLLGVKVRVAHNGTGADNALPAMRMAREIADATGTLLMFHVSGSPVPLGEILQFLKPGDIMTHAFNGHENGILDKAGRVLPLVREAAEHGIILDSGCARVHFDFNVARAAIEQGLVPATLSTDRVRPGPGAVSYSLLDIMTMFLALGISLEEIVSAVTARAARAIRQGDRLGTLRVGAVGDAAVLRLEEGDFAYDDWQGKVLRVGRRFTPVLTVKDGARWRGV